MAQIRARGLKPAANAGYTVTLQITSHAAGGFAIAPVML
jgi:hypothetical protein